MTLLDPEAIAEIIKLAQEYLVQGGEGFNATLLEAAVEQLTELNTPTKQG